MDYIKKKNSMNQIKQNFLINQIELINYIYLIHYNSN